MEVTLVKTKLESTDGVISVQVNAIGRLAHVMHYPNKISAIKMVDILNKAHLGASIASSSQKNQQNLEKISIQSILFLLSQIILFITGVAGSTEDWSKWLYVAIICTGGLSVAIKAFYSILNKNVDINVLMFIAILGAAIIQEFLESVLVIIIFMVSELIEKSLMIYVRNLLMNSISSMSSTAQLLDGSSKEISEIEIGTIIVVCPGDEIALDGIVVNGKGLIDESSITGEPIPIEKQKGSSVTSGTLCQNGFLEIKTTKKGSDSTKAKINTMIEEAQASSSPMEQIVNQFAKIYTPIVIIIAVLVAIIPMMAGLDPVTWFEKGLIVIVVACPCALVIATPIVVVSGIGVASSRGVIIKSGKALEGMGQIDTVAMDKTGTLTQGRCRVVDSEYFNGGKFEDLRLVGAIESKSTHPLATALVNHAAGCITEFQDANLFPKASNIQVLEGLGIQGSVNEKNVIIGNSNILKDEIQSSKITQWQEEGCTIVYVMVDNQLKVAIAIQDVIRDEAPSAIRRMFAQNLSIQMLTGDVQSSAEAIVKKLMKSVNTDNTLEINASMKPNGKLHWVRQHQKTGKVMMIGDGINDAPALAAANIGVAMGAGGTAMASTTSDVVILNDNLQRIPDIIQLARLCRTVIYQNILIAVAIKVVIIILALNGSVELWLAVLSDVVSLLLVIGNGLRVNNMFGCICNQAKINKMEDQKRVNEVQIDIQ